MADRRLSDVIGQEVSWDMGSRVLKGRLDIGTVAHFVRYNSGGKAVSEEVIYYYLIPKEGKFRYNLGSVDSPFDLSCVVDEDNRIKSQLELNAA